MGLLALMQAELTAQDLYQVLAEHDEASIFVRTVQEAGLTKKLSGGGPYTIFVPTDEALGSLQDRINRSSTNWKERFVMNHVITGMGSKRQIVAMSKAPTLGGHVLSITESNDEVVINEATNGATIIRANIRADNGMIHLINAVLE
ncbi:MAG: fasciclin domain-containing protein [Balneolaceae bacterium]|nr:fasciclin domain-containing protein [Balneolaceae bacterium]